MSIECKYCEKELLEELGEVAHGCLDCHGMPYAYKVDQLEKQLEKAEEVIRFYGDLSNYSYSDHEGCFIVMANDIEANHMSETAGKRARNYFKEKEGGK